MRRWQRRNRKRLRQKVFLRILLSSFQHWSPVYSNIGSNSKSSPHTPSLSRILCPLQYGFWHWYKKCFTVSHLLLWDLPTCRLLTLANWQPASYSALVNFYYKRVVLNPCSTGSLYLCIVYFYLRYFNFYVVPSHYSTSLQAPVSLKDRSFQENRQIDQFQFQTPDVFKDWGKTMPLYICKFKSSPLALMKPVSFC